MGEDRPPSFYFVLLIAGWIVVWPQIFFLKVSPKQGEESTSDFEGNPCLLV